MAKNKKESYEVERLGDAATIIGNSNIYAENIVLRASKGHGFAAEKANHLIDVLRGNEASLVGSNNAVNGPDRLVNSHFIQTKYCNTGAKCIGECFDGREFRYFNPDGSPMQIEVPLDKYASAVKAMERRIRDGQINGVTDPRVAKDIVRKGAVTYSQARNIAKFGTIESFTYDATNGIRIAAAGFGISTAIAFSLSIWRGKSVPDALEESCYVGLRVGGVGFISKVLASQMSRTGIDQWLRIGTDCLVQLAGPKLSAVIVNGARAGIPIHGAAAMNHLSKVFRGNIVTSVITTLVLSSTHFLELCRGRISPSQMTKELGKNAINIAGGAGGWYGGAAVGAAVGSAIPLVGTAAGAMVGGVIGAVGIGYGSSVVAESTLNLLIEDDAIELERVLQSVIADLASKYLLSEEEFVEIHSKIHECSKAELLKDMYASSNPGKCAADRLTAWIEDIVKRRQTIELPDSQLIIDQLESLIE